MTVADNTSRNQYTATSSQALFAYTFEIVDKDDIVVLINGIPLSEGTDYTVTGVGSDTGGNIVLTSGTTGGNIVTIYRDMPYSRTQNYTNSGDFLASEVNSDFDNLWLAGEQTNRAFSQSVRKPITDSDSISMELPEASSRANKLLGFDATGAVSTSLVTDDAETIAGIAADIETLAHIQDGTVATDAITNVNTIRTDVTAVSGVASDVTAVAGNTTNINTVATDLTGADDIGTVAGSIANVDTVAGDIANVNSVAGNSTNINTVATDLTGDDDIGTVAGSISSVNTVAPDINHVVTVSGDLAGADNIGTVATNISNVNAVGGISSDVTTVAGISTEVTAVSSNATNINTVGTNITNVNNVGSNIANVNTVAGLETEINAVVADEADIGVVGANITSVNTVSSNINSVNAVSNNMADVNNAAANATAAAASAADANTSAGAAATSANAASSSASNASSSESAALTSANNASQSAATASLNASAAATSATNASSSAANAATSESNADDSETAAAISASNASSSASTASNNAISAASSATSASNSASQAASSASAAATSATNSETAADTWNSYYSTYLGASATAPSYDLLGQPLQDGALYFNTTDDTMYVFNGSIWIAAESTINIVSVPTQLAADLTTNGNDIIFGDNDKAKFGAGSDLQIYHSGSASFIYEGGTGNLVLRANDLIAQTTGGANYLQADSGGSLRLYYNGVERLETLNTGIDVTGTAKMDGLTVQDAVAGGSVIGAIKNTDNTADSKAVLELQTNNGTWDLSANRSGYLDVINPQNKLSARFSSGSPGDFYLYEDTGTTPKFVWDSSAERLGIGNSAPTTDLDVTGTIKGEAIQASAANPSLALFESDTTNLNTQLNSNFGSFRIATVSDTGGSYTQRLNVDHATGDVRFYENTGTTAKFRWDSSAESLGIGTSSPSRMLHLNGSSPAIRLQDTDLSGYAEISANDTNSGITFNADPTNSQANTLFAFRVDGSEAMRIDSSRNLLVGKTTTGAVNAGVELNSSGYVTASVDGGEAAFFNRKTSDGSIVQFRKDNSAIGSIGSNATRVYIASSDTGLRFVNDDIRPTNGSGTDVDATKDLGDSTSRFKDLYLSGGVVFGTTGGVVSSKTLDDYEEGTFTPTLFGSTTAGTPTYTVQNGNYTKIGNTVRAHLRISVSAISGASGSLRIGGLPFIGQGENVGSIMVEQANWPTGTTAPVAYNSSSTNLRVFYMQDDAGWTQATIADEAQTYIITIMYRTTA